MLLIGAAQILFLDVPDHAAVDLSVRLARADRDAIHFAGLVNAVLRRVAREGAERLAALDAVALDTPEWLLKRWTETYGEATARAIAAANGKEPALDLTVKSDPESFAAQARRPRFADRDCAHHRARHDHGAAGLRRRRVVGAGCRGGAAGAPSRRRRRPAHRRSVRGAGRQDGATDRRWRRASPRSIARRHGLIGCAKIWPACRLRPS